jgi:hypothetical protein
MGMPVRAHGYASACSWVCQCVLMGMPVRAHGYASAPKSSGKKLSVFTGLQSPTKGAKVKT